MDSLTKQSQARERSAAKTLQAAGAAIGPINPGMSKFLLTAGYSMLDIALHVLDQIGPASLEIMTWTIADYDLRAILQHRNAVHGTLIIDHDARFRDRNNVNFAEPWRAKFGPESVRYSVCHAKVTTIQSIAGVWPKYARKVLIRGSANYNKNNRMEQIDITEGGDDFVLAERIFAQHVMLPDDVEAHEVFTACDLLEATTKKQMFGKIREWAI